MKGRKPNTVTAFQTEVAAICNNTAPVLITGAAANSINASKLHNTLHLDVLCLKTINTTGCIAENEGMFYSITDYRSAIDIYM